jgi:small Trp-rich protein
LAFGEKMYLVGLGLILAVMKFMAFGPVADWSWLLVLSPFAAAIVWWKIADGSGLTAKKAMEHEEQIRQNRLNRNRSNLGSSKSDRK